MPHDWSIELPRQPSDPCGASGGFFTTGRSWYRKTFTAPEEWRTKRVFLEFEGAYMNAEVWLGEHLLGRHPYGYTSFWHDLTPFLNLGGENTLSVMIDNACQPNSRWYSGSGIYRHLWLMIASPIHFAPWGIYVTAPEVSPETATLRVQATVANETGAACQAAVRSRVLAPDGECVAEGEAQATIAALSKHDYAMDLSLTRPSLWSPAAPHLYRVVSEVSVQGKVMDDAITYTGIRSLHFSAEQGFLLNGERVLLKGGCVHHDNGVLGAASYDRSEERKVELLKANGFNAVRCAHNPPAPAFLDACDRLGLLVIDEAFDCWRIGKNPYDYHTTFDDWWQRDIESMVHRDRNHPCIIMWSIGNEVAERNGRSRGAEIARSLVEHVHSLDPTRPVTSALNAGHDAWPWEQTDAVGAALDVFGYNYQERQYRPDHERHPQRVMYGSESTAMEAFQHWTSVEELDYVIGDFVWTALDYLGEAGIGRVRAEGDAGFLGAYPWHQANCGDLDLCGFKRPQSYYRDVLWGNRALSIMVHSPNEGECAPQLTYWGWPDVWPSWTWPGHEGKPIKVDIYSSCDRVELFLNGRSLGSQPTGRQERLMATFGVQYEVGALQAVGYVGDRQVAECCLDTVGSPTAITLTPDRSTLKATADDLSYITVEVVDSQGRVHPGAEHSIFFTTTGEGSIAAVGNALPTSTEPYRGNVRSVYRGRCLVVVRSAGRPGEIHLRAQADGLAGAETIIRVEP